MGVEGVVVINIAEKIGLAFWMDRVVQECGRVAQDFAPDPVHDLRVALRRCRSIAAGFAHFDPDRNWDDMRKEGARLFKRFGELRDAQVMIEWIKNPGAPQDCVSKALLDYLAGREGDLKKAAAGALNDFNRKKWTIWTERLSERSSRIPSESLAFRHLALERWQEAHLLHRQALRNRSYIGFHRLRIGLKKFRYIVENFLPSLHDEWGPALRELQNLLGEMHDLHVLLQTARELRAIQEAEIRARWHSWIAEESRQRLNRYRQMMTGPGSLWRVWRAALPEGDQLESAILARLQTWASFRDPDCEHSQHVADLALQLYDGLMRLNLPGIAGGGRARAILHASALIHAVGFSGRGKKGHKESYRMISRLHTPAGWEAADFKMMALVARFHRGALPAPDEKEMRDLVPEQRQLTAVLSGVLRLAVAFTAFHRKKISRLLVRKPGQALVILASGYQEYDPQAQKLARARYLLEIACALPVIIRSK